MRKIAVIGARGQLGSRIVRGLIARGQAPGAIVAVVRTPDRAAELAALGCDLRRGDYDDLDSMTCAFAGCRTVMLVPTFAPVEPRILQHARAVEAARRAGARRLVFASFIASSPESPFLVTPFLTYAESALRVSGLEWTILRNGMYADPLVPYAPDLVASGRIPYPAGEGKISYVTRDDLARASAAALLDGACAGKAYDLTGAEALSIAELAALITKITGKPVYYEPASDEEFAAMCRAPGLPDYLPQALVTIYHAAAQGFLGKVTGDIETLTGKPPEKLESFLAGSLAS